MKTATKENTVLVIVDVQEKLHPHVQKPEKLTKNIVKLIEFAKIFNIPIILSEQYPKGLGQTIPEIADALPKYAPLEKNTFSCFGVEDFERAVLDTTCMNLAIVGIETHVCVFQTTRDAIDRGYNVHLISDAVSSRSKKDKRIGMMRMKELGAVISSSEMLMFEIMEKAGTPEFKQVSPLLK